MNSTEITNKALEALGSEGEPWPEIVPLIVDPDPFGLAQAVARHLAKDIYHSLAIPYIKLDARPASGIETALRYGHLAIHNEKHYLIRDVLFDSAECTMSIGVTIKGRKPIKYPDRKCLKCRHMAPKGGTHCRKHKESK